MHVQDDSIGDVMLRLKLEFMVDVVAFSRVGDPPDRFRHVMLTHHSSDIEVFDMPREMPSFCGIVLETGRPFAVGCLPEYCGGDDCPLMRAEGYNAYLGVPVMGSHGPVAALQLMAHEARDWSDRDIAVLERYSRTVGSLFHAGIPIRPVQRQTMRLH